MNPEEKIEIIKTIMECLGEAIDLDSGDSGKEDILYDLCMKATYLPTKRTKKKWMKPWRYLRSERGSFSFLTKELLLNDEESYRNYLRVSKGQFDFILNLVAQDIKRTDTQMRNSISPAEQLALTLRFLASEMPHLNIFFKIEFLHFSIHWMFIYRTIKRSLFKQKNELGHFYIKSLNYQTRVSTSCISSIVPRVCKSISKRMEGKYLKFPSNRAEWEEKAREFAIKWQFPNCLGAVDGKHISFRPLRSDGAFYHNYKGTNSIILMALVDANCKFIFVDVGCNGRCNDAGVFLQSSLKKFLENEEEIPPNAIVGNGRCLPFVIVGDDAFPLQTHLMKPYPYHSNSRDKQMFNARLSRARHVVEHAFGILSNRFRIFLAPINLKVETVESIIYTCCILHNFLLEADDNYLSSTSDYPSEINDTLTTVYNPRKGGAELIRQQFMSYFNKEGKLDWMK